MGQEYYDQDDWNTYHKAYRDERRRKKLSERPKDDRCPICRKMVLNSQQWVCRPQERAFRSDRARDNFAKRILPFDEYQLPLALCRSCFFTITRGNAIVIPKVSTDRRYVWNGDLLSVRVKNMTELARASGYSVSYIRKICLKMSVSLRHETTRNLLQSLVALDIKVAGLIRFTYSGDAPTGDEPTDFVEWKRIRDIEDDPE